MALDSDICIEGLAFNDDPTTSPCVFGNCCSYERITDNEFTDMMNAENFILYSACRVIITQSEILAPGAECDENPGDWKDYIYLTCDDNDPCVLTTEPLYYKNSSSTSIMKVIPAKIVLTSYCTQSSDPKIKYCGALDTIKYRTHDDEPFCCTVAWRGGEAFLFGMYYVYKVSPIEKKCPNCMEVIDDGSCAPKIQLEVNYKCFWDDDKPNAPDGSEEWLQFTISNVCEYDLEAGEYEIVAESEDQDIFPNTSFTITVPTERDNNLSYTSYFSKPKGNKPGTTMVKFEVNQKVT